MMKILWVVNLILPEIAEKLSLPSSNREGWLSGIFSMMSSSNEYELAVAYPCHDISAFPKVTVQGAYCIPFYENLQTPEIYDSGLEEALGEIIDEVNPDIVHIFGTEFPHALAAAKAFNCPERTLVGIQGICSKIAEDYMALIPKEVENRSTFRDKLRKDSLKDQQDKFLKRSVNERELLKITGFVTGRTHFDHDFAMAQNPQAVYLPMNESMRRVFYEPVSDSEPKPGRHSIFLMQGDYPIKGFHFLLEACGRLVDKYPDLSVSVAGNSIIREESLKDRLKTPSYGKYLKDLIKRYSLGKAVRSLGSLNALEVRKAFLENSVYVCPSYVDNSPNSIAEAMLLQRPVIASDAGGITSIISSEEGYIFKRGNVDELAECIDRVFEETDSSSALLAERIKKANARALKDYDAGTNYRTLLDIYYRMTGQDYSG